MKGWRVWKLMRESLRALGDSSKARTGRGDVLRRSLGAIAVFDRDGNAK